MARKHTTITLTPAESLLRDFLLGCRAELRAHNGTSTAATTAARDLRIWITGGWVRDRLLGLDCHDIDLALSSMTGRQLGGALTAYFDAHRPDLERQAAALGVDRRLVRCTAFNTTKQNPGKSKNLETAVGRVFGLDVDLVNLRKEVYDDDASRTPVMEFGTAEEDALRRDATVNALFFDLDAQQVVDLTGRGLDDMAAGIMRTPLPPRQTFLDDPLRVLRLVRMCSKLGYALDPEAREWMCRREIHVALGAKVSRERFGIEVAKMMRGRNVRLAMDLIHQCGLWKNVFLGLESDLDAVLSERLSRGALSCRRPSDSPDSDSPNDQIVKPWPPTWPRAYEFLSSLLENNESHVGRMVDTDKDNIESYWLAAAYSPVTVARLDAKQLAQAVKDSTAALKLTAQQTRLLESSFRNLDLIHDIVSRTAQGAACRSDVGMAIRAWGPTWRPQLVYALLAQVVYADVQTTVPSSPSDMTVPDQETLFAEKLGPYEAFLAFVAKEGLWEAFAARPAVNGNEIMALYGIKKGGGWLKTTLDELVRWDFDREGDERGRREEAETWLLGKREEFGVPKA